jgi:hypothetical protein
MQADLNSHRYPTIPFLLGHPQSRDFEAAQDTMVTVKHSNNKAKTILFDVRIVPK